MGLLARCASNCLQLLRLQRMLLTLLLFILLPLPLRLLLAPVLLLVVYVSRLYRRGLSAMSKALGSSFLRPCRHLVSLQPFQAPEVLQVNTWSYYLAQLLARAVQWLRTSRAGKGEYLSGTELHDEVVDSSQTARQPEVRVSQVASRLPVGR